MSTVAFFSCVALAATQAAKPAYDFIDSIGVCTHLGWKGSAYDTYHPKVKAALGDLGVRHIRDQATAPLARKRLKDIFKTYGIRSTVFIDTRTSWEADGQLDPLPIPKLLDQITKDLGIDAVDALEGPNEYNLTWRNFGNANWASELRSYQAELWSQVKANPAFAAIPLMAPALAPDDEAMYVELGDLTAMADVGNGHIYSNWWQWSRKAEERLPRIQIQLPGAPLVVSEYGWQTATYSTLPVSPLAKAKYISRAIAEISGNPNYSRGFIYQLLDQEPDPADKWPVWHFGLISNDLEKTPAFYTVRNMIDLLCDQPMVTAAKGLDYTLSGDLTDIRTLLLEKNSGAFYLLVWLDVQSSRQKADLAIEPRRLTLSFRRPIQALRQYDPVSPETGGQKGRAPLSRINWSSAVPIDVSDSVAIFEIFPANVPVTPPPGRCKRPAS